MITVGIFGDLFNSAVSEPSVIVNSSSTILRFVVQVINFPALLPLPVRVRASKIFDYLQVNIGF